MPFPRSIFTLQPVWNGIKSIQKLVRDVAATSDLVQARWAEEEREKAGVKRNHDEDNDKRKKRKVGPEGDKQPEQIEQLQQATQSVQDGKEQEFKQQPRAKPGSLVRRLVAERKTNTAPSAGTTPSRRGLRRNMPLDIRRRMNEAGRPEDRSSPIDSGTADSHHGPTKTDNIGQKQTTIEVTPAQRNTPSVTTSRVDSVLASNPRGHLDPRPLDDSPAVNRDRMRSRARANRIIQQTTAIEENGVSAKVTMPSDADAMMQASNAGCRRTTGRLRVATPGVRITTTPGSAEQDMGTIVTGPSGQAVLPNNCTIRSEKGCTVLEITPGANLFAADQFRRRTGLQVATPNARHVIFQPPAGEEPVINLSSSDGHQTQPVTAAELLARQAPGMDTTRERDVSFEELLMEKTKEKQADLARLRGERQRREAQATTEIQSRQTADNSPIPADKVATTPDVSHSTGIQFNSHQTIDEIAKRATAIVQASNKYQEIAVQTESCEDSGYESSIVDAMPDVKSEPTTVVQYVYRDAPGFERLSMRAVHEPAPMITGLWQSGNGIHFSQPPHQLPQQPRVNPFANVPVCSGTAQARVNGHCTETPAAQVPVQTLSGAFGQPSQPVLIPTKWDNSKPMQNILFGAGSGSGFQGQNESDTPAVGGSLNASGLDQQNPFSGPSRIVPVSSSRPSALEPPPFDEEMQDADSVENIGAEPSAKLLQEFDAIISTGKASQYDGGGSSEEGIPRQGRSLKRQCFFLFEKGRCRNGPSCHFSHMPTDTNVVVIEDPNGSHRLDRSGLQVTLRTSTAPTAPSQSRGSHRNYGQAHPAALPSNFPGTSPATLTHLNASASPVVPMTRAGIRRAERANTPCRDFFSPRGCQRGKPKCGFSHTIPPENYTPSVNGVHRGTLNPTGNELAPSFGPHRGQQQPQRSFSGGFGNSNPPGFPFSNNLMDRFGQLQPQDNVFSAHDMPAGFPSSAQAPSSPPPMFRGGHRNQNKGRPHRGQLVPERHPAEGLLEDSQSPFISLQGSGGQHQHHRNGQRGGNGNITGGQGQRHHGNNSGRRNGRQNTRQDNNDTAPTLHTGFSTPAPAPYKSDYQAQHAMDEML